MGNTDRFGFKKLGPGESIQDDGFQFSLADRDYLDSLLKRALEQHVHTGEAAGSNNPDTPLTLTLYSTGGTIAAGLRYYYKYTLVDGDGNESAASPVAYVETDTPVQEPEAPALSSVTTGGLLNPGSYTYALSAYKDANTLETRAIHPTQLFINGTSTTNTITVTFPSLPAGATGFNIYRKAPGETRFLYLASTVASDYEDDGSVTPSPSRSVPVQNTTNGDNAVAISLPGATPVVPEGYSWKIYRSDEADNWNASLLHHVVETTVEEGDIITPTYEDVGGSTLSTAPPPRNRQVGNPPKVDLTDVAHVTGFLPPGRNVVPYVASFGFDGLVGPGVGTFQWVCEFDQAEIQFCRAHLGVGYMPAAQVVQVDVNKFDSDPETWATIYTTQANRPVVPVGETIGEPTVPDVITLVKGDALTVDIDQAGGGATPTDYNLVVNVAMYVKSGDEDVTYVWSI